MFRGGEFLLAFNLGLVLPARVYISDAASRWLWASGKIRTLAAYRL
jgi:hypothetical protein